MRRWTMSEKVVTLFGLVLLVSVGAFAGGDHKGPKVQAAKAVIGDEILPAETTIQQSRPATFATGPGDSIGFSTYDYGTNGSANHNIISYGDGTLAVGRMAAHLLGTEDRGTWYTYYDATSWKPMTKVESEQRGWSNIAQMTDAMGIEVVVSHIGNEVNVDAARGSGTWTSFITGGLAIWPKLAIGGGFSIHYVAAISPPTLAATDVVYTRSQDAGTTFDKVDVTIFTMGFANSDGYDIAAQGTNVAIVVAGIGFTPGGNLVGGDVVLALSADSGDTWTEQVIYDVADGDGELPLNEAEFQPDGSCAVVFDNDGNVHVVWGNYLAFGDATNTAELFFSISAPILHWSAATGLTIVAFPTQDPNLNLPPGRDGNFATQPDIGVGVDGALYVIFSQLISESDNALNYEHVFAIASGDGGATWVPAIDVTPGAGFDASFPSLADKIDENLHIVYNSDPIPGNWVQDPVNHEHIEVAIMYLSAPVSSLVKVDEEVQDIPKQFALFRNYPNPFNPSTKIVYELPKRAIVSLKVYDLLGRQVAVLVDEEKQPGRYEVEWQPTKVSSGVYFYRLQAGEFVETKKLILLR